MKNGQNKISKMSVQKLPTRITRSLYWRARNSFNKRNNSKKSIYNKWIIQNEQVEDERTDTDYKFSIIVPVYNVDPKYLDKCIQSVVSQTYEKWELCLYDDASAREDTKECLTKWSQKDKRIKIAFGEKNLHISGSSNEAIKMATGEYLCLLDNDDEIASNALSEAAKALAINPGLRYLYSDEDKINERGDRFAPFFKPDWNPDLLLSMMYTSHLSIYHKSTVEKVGGFRVGYEGSQDYDLVLRVTELLKPQEIYHIPKVLYHWRTLPGSTARGHSSKDYASVAAKKSLADYLRRNNISGNIEDGIAPGSYRVKRDIEPNAQVTIIIPFRDKIELLKVCVNSVLEKTDYKNYEILLVNNNSIESATSEYLEKLLKNKKIRIIEYSKEFNFSALNNFAAKYAKGSHLLFLNNDTDVINSEWLSALLEHSQRKEVAAVGAKLLYADNRIQHAGVILGMGIAGHAFKLTPDADYGFFSQAVVIRDYSAVTAACLMIKKSTFDELGGFNEKDLPVAYNDVDLCLRALEKGYINVYTPYARLYHYESASRGYEHPNELVDKDLQKHKRVTSELDYMAKTWKDLIENDPYFSPNLSRKREDFQIRVD